MNGKMGVVESVND